MASGLPFKVSPYKSILAFLISIRSAGSPQIIFVIGHPCLSYPGVTSLSGLGSPCTPVLLCLYLYPVISIHMYYRTSWTLQVCGVIISHVRIFGTSHADLSLEILPSIVVFPSSRQTRPSTRSGDSLAISYHPGLHESCSSPRGTGKSEEDRYQILLLHPCDLLSRDGSFMNPPLVSPEPCAHHQLCPAAPNCERSNGTPPKQSSRIS
jgi:hypothetical protein